MQELGLCCFLATRYYRPVAAKNADGNSSFLCGTSFQHGWG